MFYSTSSDDFLRAFFLIICAFFQSILRLNIMSEKINNFSFKNLDNFIDYNYK